MRALSSHISYEQEGMLEDLSDCPAETLGHRGLPLMQKTAMVGRMGVFTWHAAEILRR